MAGDYAGKFAEQGFIARAFDYAPQRRERGRTSTARVAAREAERPHAAVTCLTALP